MLRGMAIGAPASALIAAVFYKWLALLFAVWVFLLMGGVVSFWTKNHFAWGIQFGMLLGLSVTLAVLIWGPWSIYV